MTIVLDQDLPPGALLSCPGAAPEAHGGLRFLPSHRDMEIEAGSVRSWQADTGAHARPARPNNGNATLAVDRGRPALVLTAGQNCGFALDAWPLDAPVVSMAVLFASPGAGAGTLVTLNQDGGDDYLFLAEEQGRVRLEFRSGTASAVAALDPRRDLHLALASVQGRRLRLSVDDGLVQTRSAEGQVRPGPHTLYIGCRSDRSGILKTLGDARIYGLWVLPGRDLHGSGRSTARAIAGYWRQELGHGI